MKKCEAIYNSHVCLSFLISEADIPVVGNVFSFIFTKYHPDWEWRMCKVMNESIGYLLPHFTTTMTCNLAGFPSFQVLMWLLAIGCGLIVGKTLIHGIILSRFLRLKMFRANQVGKDINYQASSFFNQYRNG